MDITPVAPVPRTTKVRSPKVAEPKTGKAPAKTTPDPVITKPRKRKVALSKSRATLAPDILRHMIATAAYYLAEQRHFTPGYEMQDWLTAERQILSTVDH